MLPGRELPLLLPEEAGALPCQSRSVQEIVCKGHSERRAYSGGRGSKNQLLEVGLASPSTSVVL